MGIKSDTPAGIFFVENTVKQNNETRIFVILHCTIKSDILLQVFVLQNLLKLISYKPTHYKM